MAGLSECVMEVHSVNRNFESGFTGFRGLQWTSLD
jgi:hypothetical protein